MKANWFAVFWNSITNGWTDVFWGCKATWLWSIERVIPSPFPWRSPANTKLLWALVKSYYEKRNIHFVIASGVCMTCEKRFDEFDARKEGFKMLNTHVKKIQL